MCFSIKLPHLQTKSISINLESKQKSKNRNLAAANTIMAKLFCASPVFTAAFLLLLITASVSADRTCRFDGGAWGKINEAKGNSPRTGLLNCFKTCEDSKYRKAYQDTCIAQTGADKGIYICYCCCSELKKSSFDQ